MTMDDRIKEFCERLEFERKWLTSAGHLSSDIDIAFSAIRSKFLELFDKQEEPTGHWLNCGGVDVYQCSDCKQVWIIEETEEYKFCPSCGLRKVGVINE